MLHRVITPTMVITGIAVNRISVNPNRNIGVSDGTGPVTNPNLMVIVAIAVVAILIIIFFGSDNAHQRDG